MAGQVFRLSRPNDNFWERNGMSDRIIEIACPRCGETVKKDLDVLDLSQDLYRDGDPAAKRKVYNFPCPSCGAPLKVTVTEEE